MKSREKIGIKGVAGKKGEIMAKERGGSFSRVVGMIKRKWDGGKEVEEGK